MFRIIVLTNHSSSDFESRACDKAQYLLELYEVHHQIVDASVRPAMCKQLLQVSGAIPVFPQFYLQDEETNEVCILGEFYMIERMLDQGVLPGQKDPAEFYDYYEVEPNLSLEAHQYEEEPKRLTIQRSQSTRSSLCRGNIVEDGVVAVRPKVRATQSMKPLVVRDSSFGTNDTSSMYTIELDNDSESGSQSEVNYDRDTTENSFTELVLLEDEPSANNEALTVRSPPKERQEKEKITFSSTGYMDPPLLSPLQSTKTFEETEKEIWRLMKQDDAFDREDGDTAPTSPDVPERFVTPTHSFNLPLQQAMPDVPLAPKARGRPKLKLDFDALMQTGGSFRRKLVRGHSLLQSNPASRSASFASQGETIPMAPDISLGNMAPPPSPNAPNNEPTDRYVTPKHSFVGSGGINVPPAAFGGDMVEPNAAPHATRNVITVGDFERCALPGADSFRRQIVRGNSLLASSNSFRRSISRDNSSFCRSVTRGVSRYSTDESLAPLKEEVKVDKSKRRGSKKKTVRIVMSDDDDEGERAVSPPKQKLFGLVRKSSIMRPGVVDAGAASVRKAAPWEGSSSHHTKTTVDASNSEDPSEGASFGDNRNNDDDLSITGSGGSDDGSDGDSSTEFEELEDDLALPRSGLRERNLSFISTASSQSWSLYESYD